MGERRELHWLPTKTRRSIEAAVTGAERALGSRLEAAVLVGAAASPARADRARAPQVLVITSDLPGTQLRELAAQVHDAMRANVRVRVLTSGELTRSCDVFALEVAEWRDRHVSLRGDDPFADCTIEDADLVRSLEAAARGLVRRLRNRVLADLGTDGRRDDAANAVGDAIERSLVIAHHYLALQGEPPAEEAALLDAISEAAGLDPKPVHALHEELRSRGRVAKPVDAAVTLLPWLEGIVELVDRASEA